ncbi:DUF484 family protein [Verminephrobacter aporrectodeae]|uniref:DUF484 family protein n=1 Tax=Verminephrobacter aporrectodeae subsp. tuberculatae TaxID=1110392 RepID=A0ABT3KP78_9BURK|nr:DUF484 family protein [Verminephrobacter aporrectodeae]MCW5254904.1 DUF484 family protein [Verminephrobacter aporrectodeae subsp. tuberculatae]MCW5319744.1 DUF484 family protein [Verminephrobacter aporrectodeae subsp. tuberculatae]MCW8166319.1 DUF484 family protein [Verminephrobacter aporrectodeae subsp. tuberculatae]MCW8167942.1 DUF484 family protein [Verminephrobacter aporrectodeae subsp. tuberculatae]MCW8174790.1 DUF484 family protein [Verminephrobacter aporrectodeae subsp. tuberculatae]
MTTPIASISEEHIVQFLTSTPGFFERHAEVLASVQLVSVHGARAVSLQERQAEMLREKIRGLEQRIMEMLRNGSENATIAHKVHQWSGALLQVKDPFDLPQTMVHGLRTLLDVPQAAVRVWNVAAPYADAPFTRDASEDVRTFTSSLTLPFCGPNLGFEPAGWLAQEADRPAQSLALLPLRACAMDVPSPAFGLLVLGAQDPQRFDATMGTDFLARMAELASAALLRLM